MITRTALVIAAAFLTSSAAADEAAVQKFIDSIGSVAQVKRDIRAALTERCGTGHCWNVNASHICSLVAALDVRTDYRILHTFTGFSTEQRTPPPLEISDADVALMKLIFSQCKPTNYQYWSFGSVLHVIYDPSPKADAEVRRRLGMRNR